MGDTIMVRSFAPLPRLEQITFLRPDTRAFVTGEKPYPLTVPAWFPNIFVGGAVLFAAFGIYLVLAAHYPVEILGRPATGNDEWMGPLGPFLLLGVLADIGLWAYFRKLVRGDRKLGADGGLIAGKLISAKVRAAKGGNYLQIQCQFTSPQGQVTTGKKNVARPDRRLREAPPAGATVLILYDSDRLWQVL
jgi:hypothetical protein